MANTCKFNTRLVKKKKQNSDIFIYIKITHP